MELGTLGDLLGAAIGFCTVMLLLSFVVTAAAQSVQSTFLLKAWATRRTLVRGEYLKGHTAGPRPVHADVLCPRDHPLLPRIFGIFALLLTVPSRRVVEFEDFERAHKSYLERMKDSGERAEVLYSRFEAMVSDRFTLWMRWLSIAVGFAIAISFQISTTGLLKELSASADVRAKLLEINGDVLARGVETSTAAPGDLATKALASVIEEFSDVIELEELGGHATSAEDGLRELRYVLEGHSKLEEIEAFYEQALEQLQEGREQELAELTELAHSKLSVLDIGFWSRGDQFYFWEEGTKRDPAVLSSRAKHGWQLENLVGAMLTGMLLTLGAPFWYDKLKTLNILRDALGQATKDADKAVMKAREKTPAHASEDEPAADRKPDG